MKDKDKWYEHINYQNVQLILDVDRNKSEKYLVEAIEN